ncbi:MAG: hypothetical protein KF773_10085 [Deltaproteobacteria bacterium]|nr:hypothetical protein [Deltaproteobacteria bacterium]
MHRLLAIALVVACGGTQATPDRPAPGSAAAGAASAAAADDAAGEGPVADVDVPIEPVALQAWLADGGYKAWPHESGKHESAGPHGDAVLTFLAPALVASLRRGKGHAHPKGVAAVKELYEKGKMSGWAVSVKLADDSADGRNWYWYEVFSTARDARATYQGVGFEVCRDCHSERGGNDHVQSPFPLP